MMLGTLTSTTPAAFLLAGAALVIVSFLLFLQRPLTALLLILFVRALTDATLSFTGAAAGGGIGHIVASPNILLVLILVGAGGLFILTHRVPLLNLPGGVPLVLLLLTGLVGMLHSHTILFSIDQWFRVASDLVSYGLAAYLFRTGARIQKLLDALAATFVIPALIGFMQMVTGRGWADIVGNRIYGTFVHPNAFGIWLVCFFSIFLCQAFVQTGWRRQVALAIVMASSILLLGTYARASWAAALTVVVVLGLFSKRVLLFAGLIVVLAAASVPSIAHRVADPFGENSSFADRRGLWAGAIEQWKSETASDDSSFATVLNRLAGTGPGSTESLTARERGGVGYAAHNDYVKVLLEYGVLGLLFFLLMALSLLFSAYHTWIHAPDRLTSAVAVSFLALTLGILVASYTDNIFGATQNQIYFWTLAGVTAAVGHRRAVPAEAPSAWRHQPMPS
jgi:putative inorganic carbon (HCO3(-)) transporter